MSKVNERGFTLPELLVVGLVLISLLAVSVVFLRPVSYVNQDNDAQRRLGLAILAQGLSAYKADNGGWPDGIPDKDAPIATEEGGVDLCKVLVPVYLHDLPLDPELGFQYTGDESDPELVGTLCNDSGVKYRTGYAVKQTSDGVLTLSAVTSKAQPLTISIR